MSGLKPSKEQLKQLEEFISWCDMQKWAGDAALMRLVLDDYRALQEALRKIRDGESAGHNAFAAAKALEGAGDEHG